MTDPNDDLRWWRKDGDDIAETVFSNARRIRAEQDYRRSEDLIHASLYGDVRMLGFAPSSYTGVSGETRGTQLSLNVVRNMIGACVSRVACKAKPKPSFVTSGADWGLSRKAKKLERVTDGGFYKTKFYPKSNLVFRDGCIFGTGNIIWEPHYEAKRVTCKRLLPGEWLVADYEGLYGDEGVRTGYRSRWYDKIVLAEIYPEAEKEIMGAKQTEEDEAELGFDRLSDQILVREAWRLPSWPGAKDGMWARCIPGKLLAQKVHKRDRFPVVTWRWDDAIAGFYGNGLAHELLGIQLEINDILDELQDVMHGIKGKWFIEEFSRVDENDLNDEADAIVVYRGTVPVYVTPQLVSPEVYQHLWALVQRAYEITGISQLAATSQKPAGLNSGEAQRVYRDNQNERFLSKFESWDQFILGNAEAQLDALRDLAEVTKEPLIISAPRGQTREEIDFRKVDLEERVYEIQMMATSMLPTTPSGKIAFAEDMGRLGVLDPEELLEIISMPDTERFMQRRLATRTLVEDMLENMIETGEFEPPEPFMFWPTAMKVAVESYLTFRSQKCPPEKLDLVARWIVLARLMMKKQEAEDAPPPPPPGLGPMGPGGPPLPPVPLPPGGQPGVPPLPAAA